jgi:hypothetical protein
MREYCTSVSVRGGAARKGSLYRGERRPHLLSEGALRLGHLTAASADFDMRPRRRLDRHGSHFIEPVARGDGCSPPSAPRASRAT